MFGRRKKIAKHELKAALPGEGRDVPLMREELVLAQEPTSLISEQTRRLRNSLNALNADGAARAIMVTSAIQGDGKSVTTVNLALALAELPQRRILIVDGDVFKPTTEDLMGLPRRQGWSEVLQGKLSLDQACRQTSVERLHVMGPGTFDPRTNEIMNLDRIRSVFEALKRRYDYVLVDSPAVLAMNHPSVMGAIADGILLVVRQGFTPKPLVEEAFTMLENLGGNVLGTVMTATEEPDRSYGY